ncbi:MAG TPA: hypothetical protein VHV08_17755 [Pirellulales bacterium]|nr:hypothetical protein [Pirellulales bacterium]
MTKLDRAFIKAYTEPPAVTLPRPRKVEQAMIAHDARLHAGGEQIARPRARVAPQTSPGHVGRSEAMAPLSTFAAPAKLEESFRASLEVDRLDWPAACQQLVARAAVAWDRFIAQLCAELTTLNKCVAFVSSRRGEGRTTVALATASRLAAQGLRTLIVDADFGHADLAAACGVSPPVGWGEMIEGDLPLGEALITAVEDGVTLMPWRGPGGRLAHRSARLRAATSFRLLKEYYDVIIVDAMPLASSTTDFAHLLEALGQCGSYVVCDKRATSAQQLLGLCGRLEQVGVKVSGIIENFVASTSPPPLPDHAAL